MQDEGKSSRSKLVCMHGYADIDSEEIGMNTLRHERVGTLRLGRRVVYMIQGSEV